MSKESIWCMFFASLVSMRLHPRHVESLGVIGDDEPDPLVKEEVLNCAHIADVMVRLAGNRFAEREHRGRSS